ncbi:hypothetical protein HHK36_030141 [Tetracentron sinense]|uniref:Uncharacterized protein n=1 Tax=Tetracentron sinense TaxID=13715 RepID=A0A835D084_TETSI|nr:hypothetical protein HHK36_030141 [Tetracentron sinense]
MSESQNSIQLPVLDISQPLHPSSLSSLSQACKEWGFFHITGHGISQDLYSKLYSLSKHLFSLPSITKLKLGPSSSIKTYTPHFIASPFFESLRVSGPDFFTPAQTSADLLFDQPNSEFSEILQEYGSKMTEISKRILQIVLMSLGDGFERKYYESEFSDCNGYLRIINYSPPKKVEDEEVEGLGMHTDMSCVTIVYQDEIGGLQLWNANDQGSEAYIGGAEGCLRDSQLLGDLYYLAHMLISNNASDFILAKFDDLLY